MSELEGKNLGWGPYFGSPHFVHIFKNVFIYLFLFLFLAADMEDDDFSTALPKTSCITEQTQYFFENDDKSFIGIVDCINCSR